LRSTFIVAQNEYKYAAELAVDLAELPAVVCNVGELNQVFLNLLVNAAHAIEARGDTDRGTGTGQGLAISRSIVVDQHGGTLAVDSEPGRGTTFTIRLPLQAAPLTHA
jgi:two-component system NtrC family sensor kinase